jgi:UDP-glucose 4-epimerase
VVHLAARVHIMNEDAADPEAAFRTTNVDATLRLAAAARQIGVRRFVFVSSVKAVAEGDGGIPLRENAPPRPEDAYGRSKRAAEDALTRLGNDTGLEIVIVRPPLVYGPQVRANFLRLMDAIWRGVPLPLGAADARRSMVYIGNLADALAHCATDPRAAGQCFHVADSDVPTVTELVRSLGRHLGKPARLLPVPPAWLRMAGRLTGRSAQVDRLIGSLQVDTSHIRDVLGWQPPFSTDEGLAATADWYRSTH